MSEPTEPALGEGSLLGGRYRLEALAGQGGYSRVFRAHDELLGRRVAIKLFTSASSDDSLTERMSSETRLLAAHQHPSLVTLHDAQLQGTPAYLVMEYIDGPTLASVLAAGPLDATDAAGVALEMSDALRVIHRAGIVHRDIKPSNILMRPPALPGDRHRATLTDFGIAYLVDTPRVTTAGMLVGTAAYLSPEQVRGEVPTPAADIYALGLVLLEALTGQRAFAHSTPQEALVARVVRPPDIPSELPEKWQGLLRSMVAMSPDDRPSAGDLAAMVERLGDEAERPEVLEPAATAPMAAVVTPPADPTRVWQQPATDEAQPLLRAEARARRHAAPARRARRRTRGPLVATLTVAAGVVLASAAWVSSGDAGDEPLAEPTPPGISSPAPPHADEAEAIDAQQPDPGGENVIAPAIETTGPDEAVPVDEGAENSPGTSRRSEGSGVGSTTGGNSGNGNSGQDGNSGQGNPGNGNGNSGQVNPGNGSANGEGNAS